MVLRLPIAIRYTRVFDSSGKVKGVIGSCFDVTESKKAEENIGKSEFVSTINMY